MTLIKVPVLNPRQGHSAWALADELNWLGRGLVMVQSIDGGGWEEDAEEAYGGFLGAGLGNVIDVANTARER